MNVAIANEELLRPECTLPVQFQRLWHGARPTTPERLLMINILWQAAEDLHKYRYARKRRRQRLYMEAYRWVAADDHTWPFSFASICDALGLSPEFLRAELLCHRWSLTGKAA